MATAYPKPSPVDFMSVHQLRHICRMSQLKHDASTTKAALITLIKA